MSIDIVSKNSVFYRKTKSYNAGTGYTYQIKTTGPITLVSTTIHKINASGSGTKDTGSSGSTEGSSSTNTNRVGSELENIYKFQASDVSKPEHATVSLIYGRPWDSSTQTRQDYSILVV